MNSPAPRPHRAPGTSPVKAPRRWLMFVHQLPARPSNLRVRTWRRLQQLGALPLKQAAYVLPDGAEAREDFEWLKAEVEGAGGEATILAAAHIDDFSDDALVENFRRARQEDYAALAGDIEAALKRVERARPPKGRRAPAVRRLAEIFGTRLSAIGRIDFFGSAGRDRAAVLLERLRQADARTKRGAPPEATGDRPSYEARLWVTRPRPGVDRMASAWLIRRVIDPKARFDFADDRDAVPANALPFDMFGVEFSHRGDGCTFETLCDVFAIRDAAVTRIAAIVHDLDLKDDKFSASDAPTVAAMIDGLQMAHADDDALLAQGMTLFESLYQSFSRSAQPARPRRVAKTTPAKRR